MNNEVLMDVDFTHNGTKMMIRNVPHIVDYDGFTMVRSSVQKKVGEIAEELFSIGETEDDYGFFDDTEQKVRRRKKKISMLKELITVEMHAIREIRLNCQHANVMHSQSWEVYRGIYERRNRCLECGHAWNEQKDEYGDDVWPYDRGDYPDPILSEY